MQCHHSLSDDIGVSLEQIHPYFWNVEDDTFYGGDAQIKDVSNKMNVLVHNILGTWGLIRFGNNFDVKRKFGRPDSDSAQISCK